MALLEVKDISVAYGGIQALQGISLHVDKGEVVTIIGANGAGKSSLLNAISSMVPYHKGEITYQGEKLSDKPYKVVAQGIVQVPEGRQVFANLNVEENLRIGAYLRKDKAAIEEDLEDVYTRFPRLRERKQQLAGSLSGGEQQMLVIGRGLMARPGVLLLDEPSLGLAPLLVVEIFSIINDINQEGTTLLLVEQNARKALAVADRAYVLETGKIIREGSGMDLLSDPSVQEAYLGTKRSEYESE
ncbi:MAG TPA: ABC transporter ATP-binding protein [Chloroflexi bacterium]|nr:ABC transporter ATP-binding protein [Chloroflexota bacterium]